MLDKNAKHEDILFFVRKHDRMNQAVIDFAQEHLDCNQYTTISEYRNADIYIDLHVYNTLDEGSNSLLSIILSNTHEIIARDRVLRNISYQKAINLLARATNFFVALFHDYKPKYLVTYPVDNYVMDIMVRVAKLKNIEIYGVCNFFTPNLKRITVYGEHNSVRKVEDKEAIEFIEMIRGEFRSPMALQKEQIFKKSFLDYFKYKVRWVLYYFCFYKLLNKLNYDYIGTIQMAKTNSLSNFMCLKYFSAALPNKDSKSILMPLHYYPEATLEYWSPDLNNVDFPTCIRRSIYELIEKGYTIYLKEHPAMIFRNALSFYQSLNEEFGDHIKWLNPFVTNCNFIAHFDEIYAWTGSAGLEALINGKKVLFGSENYYLEANGYSKGEHLLNEHETIDFVKNVLSGTIQVGEK